MNERFQLMALLLGFALIPAMFKPAAAQQEWGIAPRYRPSASVLPSNQILTSSALPPAMTFALAQETEPLPTQTPTLSEAPPLLNPQNPVDYGADAFGVNDSSSAFQNAINAGDLDVPAGLFKINSNVSVPSNRNIRCEPGSSLEYTTTGNIAMFRWNGTSGGSVYYCHFRGPYYNAIGKPGPASSAFQEFIAIEGLGGVGGNLVIANNDFNGIGGWLAAIHIYANDSNQPGPQNNLVTHNTFENCGVYAVQVTSGKNNTFNYNTLTDCNGFVEADDLGQQNTGNIVDHNTLNFINGVAQWNPGAAYLALTCGASPHGFDYSGNTCSNNVVTGPASHIIMTAQGGLSAQYVGNSCINGCSVIP